ncbi:MAG: hypothetical protein M3220_21130, partial [Chloroflexota bacterium]|nr:hypothetical protein [Chloroflexota bacterium]
MTGTSSSQGAGKRSPPTGAMAAVRSERSQASWDTVFTLRDCPAFDEWQFLQAEGLRLMLARALEELVRGCTEQGNYEAGLDYASRWLALDPFHEPAHRHLMCLYAWLGHYAAAIRQYEECARLLDEELGVPPEEETTELYESIRTRRWPPRAKEHPAERVEPEGASHPDTTAPTQQPQRHNLPPQSTLFVGRERELADLDALLADPHARLITIVGPGGMGKTRLALAAAERQLMRSHFPHGVYFVSLAPISTVEH